MCVGPDARALATVPSRNCNPDLNLASSWPQSLIVSSAPKCHWERQVSSEGKAQDGFKWWFLAGEVTRTAGLHCLGKSSLCPAWKVKLGMQTFGIVDLMIISAAPQSDMLKQRPLQGL